MALYDNMTKEQAERELRNWQRKAKRLVERRDLASANLETTQEHMQLLRARIKVAPARRDFD